MQEVIEECRVLETSKNPRPDDSLPTKTKISDVIASEIKEGSNIYETMYDYIVKLHKYFTRLNSQLIK